MELPGTYLPEPWSYLPRLHPARASPNYTAAELYLSPASWPFLQPRQMTLRIHALVVYARPYAAVLRFFPR